jgi:NAD(P)-dependent dehydrogenase (short-subunit alcohol dehydrogenase family)
MPPYSLQGKTLFITGGASGIGAETARRASAKGAKLALVDVDIEAATRLAESLPSAIAIGADVRDYASLESAVEQTIEQFGGIDVAFANAGIEMGHSARAIPLVEMERIADINFTGVFRTVRATLPHVIERRGYVLITASLAAILHGAPLSHYTATKAGVEAFGNAVRLEYRHKGVDVGVAYFGFIDTPMVQRGKSDPILAKFEQEQGQNFVGKTYPLSGAGAAVVNGMENRARRVMYPRWIRPLYALRSLMPRLLDRAINGEMLGRMIDELDERDLVRGDAGNPSREFHERVLANAEADRYDHRGEEESERLLS